MTSISNLDTDPGKFLIVGENGTGKTGGLASLVCEGYKVRIIDTDKGSNILRTLLTDSHYPYAKLVSERKIDLDEALDIQRLDVPMSVRRVDRKDANGKVVSSETILAPKNAQAWLRIGDLLDNWKDRKTGKSFGSVESWGPDHVLVLDTLSTVSKYTYYFNQELNGRLGARETGYDHQRDIGDAQRQLVRLLEALSNDSIRANVIINTHIRWLDTSRRFNETPEQRARDNRSIDAKGYPSSIGSALSPEIGKYFNNIFVAFTTGSGASVERKISTVPYENTNAKNSVFLRQEYPIATAYAEILAAMLGKPAPTELIAATGGTRRTPSPTTSKPQTSGGTPSTVPRAAAPRV